MTEVAVSVAAAVVNAESTDKLGFACGPWRL